MEPRIGFAPRPLFNFVHIGVTECRHRPAGRRTLVFPNLPLLPVSAANSQRLAGSWDQPPFSTSFVTSILTQ